MNVKKLKSVNILLDTKYVEYIPGKETSDENENRIGEEVDGLEIPIDAIAKVPEELTVDQKRKKRLSKMFNTTYKTGDYDYIEMPEVKVDMSITNSSMKSDSYEYNRQLELEERIDFIWKTSPWYGKFLVDITNKSEKVPKKMYYTIYAYFYKQLSKSYNIIDITVYTAEYLSFNLTTLYNQLPPLYKSKILEILNKDTKVLNHKRVFKLF
jgi:hypothetical protein